MNASQQRRVVMRISMRIVHVNMGIQTTVISNEFGSGNDEPRRYRAFLVPITQFMSKPCPDGLCIGMKLRCLTFFTQVKVKVLAVRHAPAREKNTSEVPFKRNGANWGTDGTGTGRPVVAVISKCLAK